MSRILALLLGVSAVLALGTSAARAGTWEFIETSCEPIPFEDSQGCLNMTSSDGMTIYTPIPLPQVVATFSSPDQTGSYQAMETTQAPGESGDSNFHFQWGPGNVSPIISLPLFPICSCDFTIDWNGPPTYVYYYTPDFATEISSNSPMFSGNYGSYTIGSELDMFGCGDAGDTGSSCIAGGYWDPVSVPEASSVKLLGGALALMKLLRLAEMRASRRRSASIIARSAILTSYR